MSMPWFKLHTSFANHLKVQRLERILGEPLALAYVIRIWTSAAVCAPSGKIPGGLDAIEAAAGWRGKTGQLGSALVRVGLVDMIDEVDDDGQPLVELHDWEETQNGIFAKHTRDIERKREDRKARRQNGARRLSAAAPPSAQIVSAEVRPRAQIGAGEREREREREKETTLSGEPDRAGQAALPIDDLPKAVSQKPKAPDPAEKVFRYWATVMGRTERTAFDKARRSAVEARLASGYRPEDLMLAVDGCAKTPHNMGQNDRGERYDDLALICRDAAHVDRFMANAKNPPKLNGAVAKAQAFEQHVPGTDPYRSAK